VDQELTAEARKPRTPKETSSVPQDSAPATTPRPRRRAAAKPKDPSGLPSRDEATAAEAAIAEAPATSAAEEQARAFALDLAHKAVDLAADKKASDVVLLELRELTTLTDYFIIASGGSERQLQGIADGIVEGLKHDSGTLPIGREGGPSAHWVLLDYGSVIIHVMAQPEREFYALEKLWSEAPLLLRVL
jgi:ribosome-associated protein